MEVKPGFRDPEKVSLFPEQMCPFNRGNRYKDDVNVFPGPNFVCPEWRVSQRRGSTIVDKNVPHLPSFHLWL